MVILLPGWVWARFLVRYLWSCHCNRSRVRCRDRQTDRGSFPDLPRPENKKMVKWKPTVSLLILYGVFFLIIKLKHKLRKKICFQDHWSPTKNFVKNIQSQVPCIFSPCCKYCVIIFIFILKSYLVVVEFFDGHFSGFTESQVPQKDGRTKSECIHIFSPDGIDFSFLGLKTFWL